MAAGWHYEEGIGEQRAALIDAGRIVEMLLEWDDDPSPRAGAMVDARLARRADATGRGQVLLDDGGTVHLAPVPAGLTEGGRLLVEILREAVPEAGGMKAARGRPAPPGAQAAPGPDLRARLAASAIPIRSASRDDMTLEDHGWSEQMEAAAAGIVALPDLLLRIAATPAMTLIDVDGTLAARELAIAGAGAAAEAIRRFDITGSIGIDLPTLASKADRHAAAAALDAVLPPPFERTAVNGFGFLQLVRRRARASLIERLASDPAGAAARALLRQGERAVGHGAVTLAAHPRVVARIDRAPGWTATLAARIGAPVILRAAESIAIFGGHAGRAFP